ncbi:hypothetical protein MRX96_003647 [Rhipicephalus microplus]
MAALIQVVARQAQLTFGRGVFADELFRDCLARLHRIIGQVTYKDVNLDLNLLQALSKTTNGGNEAPIAYISLYDNSKFQHDYSALIPVVGGEQLVEAQRHPDLTVSPDSAPCCLTPTERNFHEILALDGPLAFLDILAPPYDGVKRDCHYYTVSSSPAGEDNVCLHGVSPPRDFWCASSLYTGPPIEPSTAQ